MVVSYGVMIWTMLGLDYGFWEDSLAHIRLLAVDEHHGNLLLRMGNPSSYAPDGEGGPDVSLPKLEGALRHAVEEASMPFPKDAEIVDITLLTSEMDIIDAEWRTFGDELVRWPTWGVDSATLRHACKKHHIDVGDCPRSRQPRHMPKQAVELLAKDFNAWEPDTLAERVEKLHDWLHTQHKRPKVMFFHCFCGCDRTGQLAAAYSVRYLNMTLTDALRENERVAGRHMYYNFQVSAQWYCESLRERGLYHHDDCGNCEPFRCDDTGIPFDPKLWPILRAAILVAVAALLLCLCCLLRCLRRRAAAPQAEKQNGYLPLD